MSPPEYGKRQNSFHVIAVPGSIIFHVLLALIIAQSPQASEQKEETWLEMSVIEKEEPPPPPPPPPPEPEPEPEPKPKPKPKPKTIDFEDIPDEPAEEPPEPPPEQKKKVRRVQGLKASSFAEGANTGLSVRAGTTLSTKATDETLSIEEAENSTAISYAAATKQPRLKKRPPLDIPQSVIAEGIEGIVKISIDITASGSVSKAKITQPLHPDADKACLSSWKSAIFRPAEQNGEPVAITNFPRRCRFKAME